MTAVRGKILVIDDETLVRQSIVAYLEDSGFQVLDADNGALGLEIFTQEEPDLILCDLRMPQVDGLSVLKSITESSPTTPFIVVSGAGVMSDVVEALRLGASDYLIKPIIDLEVLEYSVQRNLERSRLIKQNQEYREHLERANLELKNGLSVLKADQEAGRQVQKKMLPERNFCENGFEVDHLVIPSLYLSGDFVDHFNISDNEFLFYIADVSGHGASSAFVTVLLKNMTNRLRRDYRDGDNTDHDLLKPDRILAMANKELLETQLGKHLTMFVGLVNHNNGLLSYSVGGHFPMPILSTSNETCFLSGRGMPVGLFDDASYKSYELALPQEFGLTMFSDGILEILEHDSLAEKEKFLLKAVENNGCNVDSIVNALGLQTVKAAPDDIAVMTVSRTS